MSNLVRPGRKPAPKCDREVTVTELVRAFDTLKICEELFEAKLREMNERHEKERKALNESYAPDLVRYMRITGGLASKLKADHGITHHIPPSLGGGRVVITGTGEKRGASLEFIDRGVFQSVIAPECNPPLYVRDDEGILRERFEI